MKSLDVKHITFRCMHNVYEDQGDQVGQFFANWATFAGLIFWKDEVAQNNGDFLGFLLFKQIYYIFT